MRNLKKILALVLALVMTFSVMSVSSAAFKDEADFDEKFVEAAEVLTALGVIKGRGNNTFEPDAPIKRAEVAALVYRVVTGDVEDKQAALYAGAANFSDVSVDYWGAGYIGFCANGGYIKGYPDGTFKPEANVSGYEALIMVLRAIGYGKMGEFTGAEYRTNAATRGKLLGITDNLTPGVLTGNAAREVVAEIIYRALLVPQAEYTPALNYHLKDITLGYQTFGLRVLEEAVVLANEQANLGANADKALDENRTYVSWVDNGTNKTIYLAGSTTLDDLGESRYFVFIDAKNVKDRTVLYIADTGLNNVYETGDYVAAYTTTHNAYMVKYAGEAGIKLNDSVKTYIDFDTASYYNINGNAEGNYVKVIDNDDDGDADYMLKTNYFMDEVYRVNSSGIVTFYDGNGYNYLTDNLYCYEGITAGDIVVSTREIDGNFFCEKADSFAGICTKVDWKNGTITVEGEEYEQSYIVNLTDYADDIYDISEKKEYTYFMDKFGYVRIYTAPKAASQYALLTEAYLTKANNDKWISNTTPVVEISMSGSDLAELAVSNYSTLGKYFFSSTALNTDVLNVAVPGATTNVAAFGNATDSSVALSTAAVQATYKNGDKIPGTMAVDYVDLGAQLFTKGDKAYTGVYELESVVVNAVHDTEYYVVYNHPVYGEITYFTGYANLPRIEASQVTAAYAVATNVDADSNVKPYWVADVVVIELGSPINGVSDTVGLVYYNNSKETAKVYNLSLIDRLAPATDSTVYVNGYWTNDAGFNYVGAPMFYEIFNTDSELVKIKPITENFGAHRIYAGVIDRITAVDTRGDYIVLTDGTMLNIKDVPVFVTHYGAYAYETTIEATRRNQNGTVLFQGNEGNQIIYTLSKTGAVEFIMICDNVGNIAGNYLDGLWNSVVMDAATSNSDVKDEIKAAIAAIETAQAAIFEAEEILAANNIELTATQVEGVLENLENGVYTSDVEYALALLAAAKADLDAAIAALKTAYEAAEELTAAQIESIEQTLATGEALSETVTELVTEIKAAPVSEETAKAQLQALKDELVYQVRNDAKAKDVYVMNGDVKVFVNEISETVLVKNEGIKALVAAWTEALTGENVVFETVECLLNKVEELKGQIANAVATFIAECEEVETEDAE